MATYIDAVNGKHNDGVEVTLSTRHKYQAEKIITADADDLPKSLTAMFSGRADYVSAFLGDGYFFKRETLYEVLEDTENEGVCAKDLLALSKILKKMEDEGAEFFFVSNEQ